MSVIIPHKKSLHKIISQIKQDGFDKLHVLTDFDNTLTYNTVDGVKTPSVISILRNGQYLVPGYDQKAHALFDKYHSIERNPHLKLAVKKRAMNTWWRTHKKLLIKSGLNKKDLKKIVKDPHIKFRQGVDFFLDYLRENNVPLVILSASGVGEAIPLYFKNAKKDYKNIYYLLNHFNWKKNGFASSIKEPVIHSLNKNETIVKNFPKIYQQIKNRKNVLLLGDSIHDIDMITGFDYDNLLKIGFLNYADKKIKKSFLKHFDIIIADDKDFTYINKLLKNLGK